MNAKHEHVTVNLPPNTPYYTHSTADTWHPTLVPKNPGWDVLKVIKSINRAVKKGRVDRRTVV